MPDHNPNPRNGFENAVFVLGLVLVLALLAALVHAGLTRPDGPADLRATVVPEVPAADGSFRARVVVTNVGGAVAEDVRVEVCGRGGPGGEALCAEAEIPYVPAEAVRRAVVSFRKAPSGALAARVVSFLVP